MIQTDRETFQMMLHQIMERFDRIEDRLSRMNRQTSALDGDKLLDNQDMCELLSITKRTLARYRQKKLVTYYMIDGRPITSPPRSRRSSTKRAGVCRRD